jgi:hypothetical protein
MLERAERTYFEYNPFNCMYTECSELCGNKEIELSEVYHIEKLALINGKFRNVCC